MFAYVFIFLGSDTLFCIGEHREEIKKMLPNAMKDMKNLHDLSKMDDWLHLLQYMIKLSRNTDSG